MRLPTPEDQKQGQQMKHDQGRRKLFIETPIWECLELLWKGFCDIGAQSAFESEKQFIGCLLSGFEEWGWTTSENDSAGDLFYRSTPKLLAGTGKQPGRLELCGYWKPKST
jgi:hypothetical protein